MSLLHLPLELKTLILREVFKGAEIQLATPFSLPHVQQLIHTNKALAVFAFKGLAGNIAEEILLLVGDISKILSCNFGLSAVCSTCF